MDKRTIIKDIIRSRRSTFAPMYTGGQINDDIIWEILENANWAPTHKKTEPWFFIVIPQEKIPDLCAYGSEWYKEYTPPELFKEAKYTKTKTKALTASHIIAICMKRDEEKRVPKWEEKAAVACAVQNMYLTVTALDLGCYWSTPGYMLAGDSFLQLEKGEKCMGIFYVGVPKEGLNLKGDRQDIKSKVRWMQ